NADVIVARFEKNGKLDDSFGYGGVQLTDFGSPNDAVCAVAIDNNQRIVSGGQTFVNGQSCFALSRYNADGTTDLSFNGTGKLITPLSTFSAVRAIVIQPDNKIIAAGVNSDNGLESRTAVIRYNQDGTPDASFGNYGISEPVFNLSPTCVLLQTDGKLVIGGFAALQGADSKFGLVRLNMDGTTDISFNGGNTVTTQFGSTLNYLNAIALGPDGKITAGGYMYNGTDQDYAIARYKADGTPDNEFNGNGTKVIHFSDLDDVIYSIAIQGGKILAAGYSYVGNGYDFTMVRLNQNGSLDNSFGKAGKLIDHIVSFGSYASAMQCQDDGKLLVAGSYIENVSAGSPLVVQKGFIARYNKNGWPDFSFGNGGLINVDANSIFSLFNDKIIVAIGQSGDFSISSFKPDGNPDLSFGSNGVVTQDFGADEIPMLIKQQSGSKFLVGGFTNISGSGADLLLARFTANGQPDLSFGIQGKVVTDITSSDDYMSGIAVQGDGKILVSGTYYALGQGHIFLVRYTADGVIDVTFGDNGKFIYSESQSDNASAVAVMPNGTILLTAYSVPDYSMPFIPYILAVTSGGLPEYTFASNGKLVTDVASLVVQRDGKILTGGRYFYQNTSDLSLSRFNPTGTPDYSFGINGKLINRVTKTEDGVTRLVLKNNELYVLGYSAAAFGSAFIADYSLSGNNARTAEGNILATDSAIASSLKIFPNPSSSSFKLVAANANNNEPIYLHITDVSGRLVEVKQCSVGDPKGFGYNYKPGIYFADIQQGDKRTVIKLVKL
ncbi:MAG: Delta-60 repeat-containing protein, partial [Chitinophagaceae bacterium]|nr:Delta-60 repeat-containing protein [Chitinophagaceae bacterium]